VPTSSTLPMNNLLPALPETAIKGTVPSLDYGRPVSAACDTKGAMSQDHPARKDCR
jgi:hypothetical protein